MSLPAIIEPSTGLSVEHLREWRIWLETANVDDAVGAAERTKIINAALKAAKAAEEMLVEAIRVQATAWRRLDQFGALNRLQAAARRPAAWLGAMTQPEFECFLAEMTTSTSLFTRYRQWYNAQEAARHAELRASLGDGRLPISPIIRGGYSRMKDLNDAVGMVLDEMATAGRFDVASTAERLRELLDLPFNEATREGLKEVVRHALRSPESDDRAHAIYDPDSGEDLRPPAYVTYQEDEIGWVRLEWAKATREHFRCMVRLREDQSCELLSAARRMRRIGDLLDDVEAGVGETCGDLWEIVRQKLARYQR